MPASLLRGGARAARPARFIFLAQPEDQKTVTIIAFDGRVIDRVGKLDRFLNPAVSDFELVMRDSFAAGSGATRSANAQHAVVERDLNVPGTYPRQIDFHDPAIV